MEETSVVQSPFGEAPFSELISHWLDEGDRLSASAAAAPTPPATTETRLRHIIQQLRPVIARHRLFVFAGLGLLPLALLLGTHRGAPSQVVSSPPTVISTILDSSRGATSRGEEVMSPGQPSPPVSRAQAHASPAPGPAAFAGTGAAGAKTAPHHHHHHHHHHAAIAPGKTVAPAGRAARR